MFMKQKLFIEVGKFWDIEQKVGECEWCQGQKMGTKTQNCAHYLLVSKHRTFNELLPITTGTS